MICGIDPWYPQLKQKTIKYAQKYNRRIIDMIDKNKNQVKTYEFIIEIIYIIRYDITISNEKEQNVEREPV